MENKKIITELLECSKINFENLERAYPIILQHPYYVIAKAQMDEGLGYETVDEKFERWKKNEGQTG